MVTFRQGDIGFPETRFDSSKLRVYIGAVHRIKRGESSRRSKKGGKKDETRKSDNRVMKKTHFQCKRNKQKTTRYNRE